MHKLIIADNQDITRAGMAYVLSKRENISYQVAGYKFELILLLNDCPDAVVILDYTLVDIWSEELSVDFIRNLVNASNRISVLMKDAKMSEIEQCLDYVLQGQRFLCQHATNMILAPISSLDKEAVVLTKTETEILKEIALGITTREIAEKRFSSFHTVNTHRKNIFRKLGVNNVHEAIRYAMRSGLVDAAEYYI